MTAGFDATRLDDPAIIGESDASGMLRATATAAAQLRESWSASLAAGLVEIGAEGLPRSIVICGMGGSGIAGELALAALGRSVPIPVVSHRDFGVPGWVGAADLVIGVSSSGATRETLSAIDEARRRHARLVGVGADDSALADLIGIGRGHFVAVRQELAPRASLWALATPVLAALSSLDLLDLGEAGSADEPPAALEAAAARLEQVAITCRPDLEAFVNPAKDLAITLTDGWPLIWGAGQCGGVGALRLGCQLAENAKLPAVVGVLPEAAHNQVVCFDGAAAGSSESDAGDFFRDRADDVDVPEPLQLVLVRDDNEGSEATAAADAATELAGSRGLRTTTIRSDGDGPIERLASMLELIDFASVYAGILRGIDPTPIAAIDQLKAGLTTASYRS